MLQELLDELDALEKGGPDAETATGEIPSDLMEKAVQLPGGTEAILERYASSSNVRFPRALSFILSGIADDSFTSADDADPNHVFRLIERMPESQWQETATQGNCIAAMTQHTFNDNPWTPSEAKPKVLVPFLLQCLKNPERQDVTINVFWALHNWSSGGLREVLDSAERRALREQISALGLEGEADQILEALGED